MSFLVGLFVGLVVGAIAGGFIMRNNAKKAAIALAALEAAGKKVAEAAKAKAAELR
jgi:hypothetical protein